MDKFEATDVAVGAGAARASGGRPCCPQPEMTKDWHAIPQNEYAEGQPRREILLAHQAQKSQTPPMASGSKEQY